MTSLHSGQCGLCAHFGESHRTSDQKLILISSSKSAPEDLVDRVAIYGTPLCI